MIGNNIGNTFAIKVGYIYLYACKLALYVFYLIGNIIGTNDQQSSHQDALRSPIGYGAALGCRG
jgi:hypothetical protein